MLHPFAGLALAFALAGSRAQEEGEAQARRPNVLLVSLEAVRADRLGCYGRAESVTPRIDSLASEGATFERAYAHAPLVLPACASLMTGVTPLVHGLHEDARLALGPELPTLAGQLRAAGYRTAAFQGSLELAAMFGLDRGFELYDDQMGAPDDLKALSRERRARFVVGAFLEWLKRTDGDAPFFAWLHLPDARAPYEPPVDLRELGDPYDGELAAVDRELGRALDALAEKGALDDTIVVLVGAMGEALGDQGEATHGLLLQESVVRVPLIVRLPSDSDDGRRVDRPVGQADVMPTILDLTGTPRPRTVSIPAPIKGHGLGGDLATFNTIEMALDHVYIESEVAARQLGWSTMRGLVRGSKKLVVGPEPRLYDVVADPREEHDLSAEEPELLVSMEATLANLLASGAKLESGATPARGPQLDRLVAIAYELPDALHGAPLPERGAVDPRAQAGAWNAYQAALQTSWNGSPQRMVEPLERALELAPDCATLHVMTAVACERTRRFEEAITHLDVALDIDPELAIAHYYRARAKLSSGEPGEAESDYLLAIEVDPDHELAHRALARRYLETQRPREARPYLERLTQLRPAERMNWTALLQIDRAAGAWAQVSETLTRAVQANPEDLYLRNYQAWVLATAPAAELRDPERAIELTRALAAETANDDPGILDTLAAAYAADGQFEEAVRQATRALELARARRLGALITGLEARLALYREQKPYLDQ